MDFERIQQLASTARVLRANSEQQKRRRDQNAQDFSELLEENMEEDSTNPEEQAKPQAPPTLQDTVTISSTGKVSAETMRAASTLARISIAQRQMLELFNPSFNAVADGADAEPVAEDQDQLDEMV